MFVRNQKVTTPIAGKSGSRCGECGGNLYLEPDEAITPFMATQIVQKMAAAAAHAARPARRLTPGP